MKTNDIPAEVSQELRSDIARMKALAERDEEMNYEREWNDGPVYQTSCGCQWSKRDGFRECKEHKEIRAG